MGSTVHVAAGSHSGVDSIPTHPEGFWDVHRCTRTPLCDAGSCCSQPVLWSGKWGSRRCVHPVCTRDRTEPADSRTEWSRARTGPRDSGSSCNLDNYICNSWKLVCIDVPNHSLSAFFSMLLEAFAPTLTWDDVIVGGDGVAFIKNKKFAPVETLRETLQILVDSTFQLVNLFTHILQAAVFQILWVQSKNIRCLFEVTITTLSYWMISQLCHISWKVSSTANTQTYLRAEVGRAPFAADPSRAVH